MMKRNLRALFVVAGVVSILFAGGVYIVNRIMLEKPLPRELKLTDINSDVVVSDVVWPNAEPWSFQLLVGLNTNKFMNDRPCPEFTGVVTFSDLDGTPVEQFKVSSTNAQQSNWLSHDHGLDGFIVTWKQTDVLRNFTAGSKYKIELRFEKRPDEFNSLWLSYVQTQKQKEETPNNTP